MPTTYATKEAAKKLEVSPNTLRNWSEQYSAFLSESARPGHQPERRFTDKDITVLTYVKQKIRAEGMEKTQIIERLKETEFQDVELLEPETTTLQQATDNAIEATTSITSVAPESTLTPQESHSNAPAVLVALQAMQNDIEALKASSQASEHSRRDYVQGMAIGFMVACGLFILLLLLFLVRQWLMR